MKSEDKFDPELPLIKTMMILWKQELEPFIEILAALNSSILPVLFNPPASIHICLYLPTAGLEN